MFEAFSGLGSVKIRAREQRTVGRGSAVVGRKRKFLPQSLGF